MSEIIQSLLHTYHTVRGALADGKITAAEARQIAREACGLVLLLLGGDESPQTKQLAAAIHSWSETTLAAETPPETA